MQEHKNNNEDGEGTEGSSEGYYTGEIDVFYECLASAIDTRIGYNIAVKSMLSGEEDVNRRAWHDGAIRELDLLRMEFTGTGNYFLHSNDEDEDEDEDGEDDNDEGNEEDAPIKPAPKEVPLNKKPSSIPEGFRLPKGRKSA